MSDYYFDDVRTLADHLKYLDSDSSRIRLNSTLIMLFAYYYFNIDIEDKPKYLFDGSIVVYNTGSDIKEIKEAYKKHHYSKSEGYKPKRYMFDENSELDKEVNNLIKYIDIKLEENFTDFELFVTVTDMVLYSGNPEEYFNTAKTIPHDLVLDSIYRYSEDEDEEEDE